MPSYLLEDTAKVERPPWGQSHLFSLWSICSLDRYSSATIRTLWRGFGGQRRERHGTKETQRGCKIEQRKRSPPNKVPHPKPQSAYIYNMHAPRRSIRMYSVEHSRESATRTTAPPFRVDLLSTSLHSKAKAFTIVIYARINGRL